MKGIASVGECMIELSGADAGLWRMGFAGDTLNTLWGLKAVLGDAEASYVSAFGDDRFSRDQIAFLAANGIGIGASPVIPGARPGLYAITLHGAERSFTYWRSDSAARRLAEDPARLEASLRERQLIYFSGITLAILPPEGRNTLISLARSARQGGKTVAFDPNIRPRLWAGREEMLSTISAAAATASIVLPGFDDEAAHFGDGSIGETIARYRRLGAGDIVLKDGARGATLAIGGEQFHVPAHPAAEVVDTTSAGDSFNGGYLMRLAAGDRPVDAARFASRLASAVIGHPGALIGRETLGL